MSSAIDFHDTIAVEFDQKYASSAAFLERYNVWTSLLEKYVKPTDRIMDLGCGSGIFSGYLGRKGCHVVGIDGSAAMINLCKRRSESPNVRYVQQVLPLVNPAEFQQQDGIIMSSLLEYVTDPDQFLLQVWGLLKPNGLLIVSIPNVASIYRKLEQILFRLTGKPSYVRHIRNRSDELTFRRHLTSIGFDVLEIRFFSSHDPISNLFKLFLAQQCVNSLLVVVCRKRDDLPHLTA